MKMEYLCSYCVALFLSSTFSWPYISWSFSLSIN